MSDSINAHLKWLDEMVIPGLVGQAPKDHSIFILTEWNTHNNIYSFYITNTDGLAILRKITVDVLDHNVRLAWRVNDLSDYDDTPRVEFYKNNYEFQLGDQSDLEFFQRRFIACALEPISAANAPSKELVAKVNEINEKWLYKDYRVTPYVDNGEFGDDWKLQLAHVDGTIYTRHICPNEATGHLMLLMSSMYNRAWELGRNQGALLAMADLAERNLRNVQKDMRIAEYELPARVKNFLNNK